MDVMDVENTVVKCFFLNVMCQSYLCEFLVFWETAPKYDTEVFLIVQIHSLDDGQSRIFLCHDQQVPTALTFLHA